VWRWLSHFGPVFAFILVTLIFAAVESRQEHGNSFLTWRNLQSQASQNAYILTAALGATIVIIAGGIDLSVGTCMAMCSVVLAWMMKMGYSPPVAVAACLAAGAAAGLVNGLLINGLRVAPFIVTLGTQMLFLGIAKQLARSSSIRPENTPEWLRLLLSNQKSALIAGFPLGVWVALGLSLVLVIVLRYTVFGRRVYAVGSNEATARLCGVPVVFTKTAVYVLAGLFAAIAGIMLFSRISEGNATAGNSKELDVIASVVVGGASLSGGRGSVLGTMCGVGILAVILNGCNLLGLPNPVTDVVRGLVIVAAVAFDQWQQRRAQSAL
jgi:ribose/xylose/arabinose/galactoside ABC-type transport system permease subunit